MKTVSHLTQQKIWDKEHKTPYSLLQMDSSEPSSGVIKFYEWLKERKMKGNLNGLDLGCGKGRNAIWLSKQGFSVIGLDFSPAAIKEAKKRVKLEKVDKKVKFTVADATKKWPLKDNSLDFILDCFATTDIESEKGRRFACKEMARVLKPEGYLLIYVMSEDDQYHKQMRRISPAKEKNAFIHPQTGKFEKVFSRNELLKLHSDLKLMDEQRVPKKAIFFGKEYDCLHHWMVFQKP